MSKAKSLPPRSKVKSADTWDLSTLFKSDADWEKAFAKWSKQIGGFENFRGTLGKSAEMLAACLKFDSAFDRQGDRIGTYASLRCSEDQGNSNTQRMMGRYSHVATQAGEAASFIRPEIMAIKPTTIANFMKSPELADWKLALDQTLRYKPHTLTNKEEQMLAMQGQMSQASSAVFRQLNDVDLKWPLIKNEKGELIELGHSSYSAFTRSPDRRVRKEAFHAYYKEFEGHKHTLAAALNGSAQRDAYYAKVRGYPSAREASLFHDKVPLAVYDNLISAVHKHLPAVHRYYAMRKRVLKVKSVHMYDTYCPLIPNLDKKHTWEQGVKVILQALAPLGDEYGRVLKAGLTTDRWCDRYPNAGKTSGAFSSGSYEGAPYILMNYQPEVLDHVFTLAHEAGHSMHSWYSSHNQPYQYWNYTIFVAEVASTFNEQLLLRHLMDQADDKKQRAYLLNQALDEIRGTIVRQTMFAEFEKISHALVEAGEPLTVDTLRREYRKLIELYFGPEFAIDAELELECMRIPHFYRAFYVYKYATGLGASIALSHRVLHGGKRELNDYLTFLKGGCSKYPLDLLRDAGVDMEKPEPINAAMSHFSRMLDEMDDLV